MKDIKTSLRHYLRLIAASVFIVVLTGFDTRPTIDGPGRIPNLEKDQSIMLALLLDTSNSMDGLIEQAKSQLWRIVNELSAAKCGDGSRPAIKIALYEYGNDGLPASEGYIRQVSPFTADLDLISEKLFALTTNGGNEFCGYVVRTSLNQLAWPDSGNDLKMIFIAGNEPFTQGKVPYSQACMLAKERNVIVNTIFCGNFNEGLRTAWKSGADITGGTYMSIEQNSKTVYIPTPFDSEIDAMNERLNGTYVYYGKSGASRKELQLRQDENAQSFGLSNKVERTISKSSHIYDNSSWDMVDAYKENEEVITKAKEEELPAEMKGMTSEQRKAYVIRKADERHNIQKEILALNIKRQAYISKQPSTAAKEGMLDAAMIRSLREQAATKGLKF